jgi:hypothetical protein
MNEKRFYDFFSTPGVIYPCNKMYNSAQASGVSFDASEILVRFLKYIFEGLMVAVAAYFIPNTKLPPKDLMMISLVGAATFAVLDLFAPAVGSSVRTGAGFGIGANLVGFPGGGMR